MTLRRRCIILVLDGLGIGAMPDVATTRPADQGANSLAHALRSNPRDLPTLDALGLRAALDDAVVASPLMYGLWGSAGLVYAGADSYSGHLELIGADTSGIGQELFGDHVAEYERMIASRGHGVSRIGRLGRVLLVDEAMCVADSLEADPGLNYNVTGSLSARSFDRMLEVATIVRERAPVHRVIAVGGHAVSPRDIVASLRVRNGVEGVDTPALGVYRTGVTTRHLGFPVSDDGQILNAAAQAGLSVTLIGKAADLLGSKAGSRAPAVETWRVFDLLTDTLRSSAPGLVVANVQELDLAGHQHEASMYMDVLADCDARLGAVVASVGPEDALIITGDHGNDPTRSTGHTRERVPLLFFSPGRNPRALGHRSTLADVAATAARWLGLPPPSRGSSFLRVDEVRL